MLIRRCAGITPEGQACRARPLRDDRFCFWHSPEKEDEAAEARKLGGLRRRREKVVAGAYDLDGLGSVHSIRRLIEIVMTDSLGLENSIARGRLLISVAGAATKLLEVGELEARLAALEAAKAGKADETDGFEDDVA